VIPFIVLGNDFSLCVPFACATITGTDAEGRAPASTDLPGFIPGFILGFVPCVPDLFGNGNVLIVDSDVVPFVFLCVHGFVSSIRFCGMENPGKEGCI
jgi:hypothetical protein